MHTSDLEKICKAHIKKALEGHILKIAKANMLQEGAVEEIGKALDEASKMWKLETGDSSTGFLYAPSTLTSTTLPPEVIHITFEISSPNPPLHPAHLLIRELVQEQEGAG